MQPRKDPLRKGGLKEGGTLHFDHSQATTVLPFARAYDCKLSHPNGNDAGHERLS